MFFKFPNQNAVYWYVIISLYNISIYQVNNFSQNMNNQQWINKYITIYIIMFYVFLPDKDASEACPEIWAILPYQFSYGYMPNVCIWHNDQWNISFRKTCFTSWLSIPFHLFVSRQSEVKNRHITSSSFDADGSVSNIPLPTILLKIMTREDRPVRM